MKLDLAAQMLQVSTDASIEEIDRAFKKHHLFQMWDTGNNEFAPQLLKAKQSLMEQHIVIDPHTGLVKKRPTITVQPVTLSLLKEAEEEKELKKEEEKKPEAEQLFELHDIEVAISSALNYTGWEPSKRYELKDVIFDSKIFARADLKGITFEVKITLSKNNNIYASVIKYGGKHIYWGFKNKIKGRESECFDTKEAAKCIRTRLKNIYK